MYSRNKYRAKKVSTKDGTFDSKREFRRWIQLKALERAGEITELERQVEYVLLPSQKDKETGKTRERPVKYVADFRYKDNEGKVVVEDTKGMRTKDYILKRKMMLWFHDIWIREI